LTASALATQARRTLLFCNHELYEKSLVDQGMGYKEAHALTLKWQGIHLSRPDEQQGRIVELRFFGVLATEEIAKVLGISASTVKRTETSLRSG
jgi:hypothetical protein